MLFDIIAEYFDVSHEVVEDGEAKESGSSSECLVKDQDFEEEELDDEELAKALGAPKREQASASFSGPSVESLHTGLTNDLEKVSLKDSPRPQIITTAAPKPVPDSVLMDKRIKIEALKHLAELGFLLFRV